MIKKTLQGRGERTFVRQTALALALAGGANPPRAPARKKGTRGNREDFQTQQTREEAVGMCLRKRAAGSTSKRQVALRRERGPDREPDALEK